VETVVNGCGRHEDCPIENSTSEDAPTEVYRPSEVDVPWEHGDKIIVVPAEEYDSHAITDSMAQEVQTNGSLVNWTEEVNESYQDDCEAPFHDSTTSDSPIPETLTDISLPSPIEAPSPTWAEVAASPIKNQSYDSKLVEDWGDVSGKSWDWERNWR
jgi:hypothetical protein